TGDAAILATALLTMRNAHQTPSDLPKRLRFEAEAVRAGERGGSEGQRCLALSWRAVDLLESGDAAAAQRDVDAIARVVAAGGGGPLPALGVRRCALPARVRRGRA